MRSAPATAALLAALLLSAAAAPAQAGLTHYWTWRRAPEREALRRCAVEQRRLLDARAAALHLDLPPPPPEEGGPGPLGPPLFAFNGSGEEASEPFVWPGRLGFNFCKTAGKPYDALVTAVLIAARDCFGPELLAIGSDAEWADWAPGAALYREVLGREAKSPFGGQPAAPAEAAEGGPEQRQPAPAGDHRLGVRGLAALFVLTLLAFLALYAWDRKRSRPLD
jgi:hypothetical protein